MSGPHSVPDGGDLVYGCRLTYQGTSIEPMQWEGLGVTGGTKTSAHTTIPVLNSLKCSYGECWLLILAAHRHRRFAVDTAARDHDYGP